MKSIYYEMLMYLYKTGDNERREYIEYILEYQAIKRGLYKDGCK
jgi:hypothetical protein